MGAAGGVIRELNTKHFSWRELFVRAVTGAFGAALAGLYLKHTTYPLEMQFAIAGAIGTTACELIRAVRGWIIRKMGGDERGLDMDEDNEVPERMGSADSSSGGDNLFSDGGIPADTDSNKCSTCWNDECDKRCCKGSEAE